MTSDSDSYGEMHRLPFQPFGDEMAERLLSGRMPAADAPSELRELAGLMETVAGSPVPEETAHKATVVAAAIAAVEAAAPVHSAAHASLTQTSRRPSMLSKLLTAKAAAAATVAALGLGTAAAAATGALPMQQANHHADAGLTISASGQSNGSDNGSTNGGNQPSGKNTTGAAENPNAQFGLCTAFLAHHPASGTLTSVPSDKSKTFSAFESAASHDGLANTWTYCQTVISDHSTTTLGTDTNGTNDNNGKTDDNGTKPADAGQPSTTPPVETPNSGGTHTADTASGDTSSTGTGMADNSSSGASANGSGNAPGR